jgi:hypothetical protein
MDLESGDTIYIEATIRKTVELRGLDGTYNSRYILTPAEARVMANALLGAANEAEGDRSWEVTQDLSSTPF